MNMREPLKSLERHYRFFIEVQERKPETGILETIIKKEDVSETLLEGAGLQIGRKRRSNKITKTNPDIALDPNDNTYSGDQGSFYISTEGGLQYHNSGQNGIDITVLHQITKESQPQVEKRYLRKKVAGEKQAMSEESANGSTVSEQPSEHFNQTIISHIFDKYKAIVQAELGKLVESQGKKQRRYIITLTAERQEKKMDYS